MTDNEEFIKSLKILMIVSGFWKKPIKDFLAINKIYYVYFILSKLLMVVFCFELFFGLLQHIMKRSDSQIIISSTGVLITCVVITFKGYICIKRRLIENLDEVVKYESEISKTDDQEIKKAYMDKAQLSNIMCIVQALVQCCASVALFYLGITGDQALIEYNRIHNTSIDSPYWYQIWFPATKLDHLIIIYGLNGLFCIYASLSNIVAHSIIATLMIFAATQLQILNIKLKKFIKDVDDNLDHKTIELKRYVKQHQDLIKYVNVLNNKVNIIILMHFLLNSIEISFCITGLSKNTLTSQRVFLITYINVVIYQLFMTSWNANEIIEQSTAISDAIYASNWHLLDKEGKVICQIVMQRAQRPLQLTIGPFGPMTNRSGLLVIKAAYSYFSLMNGGHSN
ncbi:odorant receptor 10-like isoform X1 [Rhynchophorus ferrugineus]|uniref:odorant receptor 10-like isoform X1 n=1 Tax=Rhynchophorus ferrugineus TaxID=354439 RepID=UPI003FCD934C